MSQKSLLIAFTIAIVLTLTIETSGKRIGCASFGHSCYGGHGKRSGDSGVMQENDSDLPPLPVMRFLQRRLTNQQDTPMNELQDHEKEAKMVILSVLNNVIEDSLKKLSTTEQEIIA